MPAVLCSSKRLTQTPKLQPSIPPTPIPGNKAHLHVGNPLQQSVARVGRLQVRTRVLGSSDQHQLTALGRQALTLSVGDVCGKV